LADEAGTRTIRRRCTALTLTVALLAPTTAAADRLRTIDVATGASTVLAASPALEWIDRPCWAPDGRVVALEYRSTRWSLLRRYMAYGPDAARRVVGRANRLTTAAVLAPGCARVAERRRRMPLGGRGVMVRNLTGAPLAELSGVSRLAAPDLAWSADGAVLAEVAGGGEPSIRVTRVGGGSAEVPAEAEFAAVGPEAFAPDGGRLALLRGLLEDPGAEVTVLDLATGALRTIAFGESGHDVAWSPRGDRIAAVLDDEIHLFDAADGRDLGVVAPGARARRLAWSPDGAQLAFSATRAGRTAHYVVAAEPAAVPRRLVATPALASTRLAWSPDGTRLAVGGG
jgi:WD40-like Beta Propeller Repeat